MQEEEKVQCPYNLSHIILKHRMAAHLVKCRRQHLSKNFLVCPFNSTHVVPSSQIQNHIENCQDRRKLDSFIYVTKDSKPISHEDSAVKLPTFTENWDEEPDCEGSYLDAKTKIIETKPLFQIPVGMPKAERKKFFHKEVERFGNILKDSAFSSSCQAISKEKTYKKHK